MGEKMDTEITKPPEEQQTQEEQQTIQKAQGTLNAENVKKNKWKSIKQFIGFCLVGGSNVIISWSVYYLFVFIVAKTDPSTIAPDVLNGMKEVSLPFATYLPFSYTGYVTTLQVQIGTLLGFILSVINGFLLNYFQVFKGNGESFWRAFFRFVAVYILTSYILTVVLTHIITTVNLFGCGVLIAPLICTLINTPTNFFFSKKWAFKEKKTDGK